MKKIKAYLVQIDNGDYVYNGKGSKSIINSLWASKSRADKCAAWFEGKAKVIEVEIKVLD